MSNFCLPTARVAYRATSFTALTLFLATTALAQSPSAEGKLDAVLESRASQLAGRSRVIVEFKESPDLRAITAQRGRAGRRLTAHRAQVAEIDNAALTALAADPRVARVMVDRPVFATLFRTGSATGATTARQQFDVCGRGVGIAVIDSGITSWHDDLNLVDGVRRTADSVVHFKDLTQDPSGGRTDLPSDGYGHGTHVAGTIAGSGYDSDGARAGIAPCVHLVGLKVLDSEGHGYISDVIAALDYAVAVKDTYNIRVINLSVASGVFESYKDDPLTQAARRAVNAGIVVVAAAGNLGVNEQGQVQNGGITSPGNAPWVLTVGAASHHGTARRSDDTIGNFSSRGPTWIDFAAKPDLVAPGVGIESTADPYSTLSATYSAYLLNGTRDVRYKPYLSLSGTSMAAPVVAGAVALMLEANPQLTPNLVKAVLQYTSQVRSDESPLAQGAGLVNVSGAIRMARFLGAPKAALGATSDLIEGEIVPWSRQIIWGNFRVTGGVPLSGANAWATGLTWGALKTGKGAAVVWGARIVDNAVAATGSRDNIVWATGSRDNIVWATGGRDNTVWATRGRDNIVWATGGRDNIVWATHDLDNIVWATGSRDNIVWATHDHDNIVWATATAKNLVWGNACGGGNCERTIWGPANTATVWGTAKSTDNTVWAASESSNIVWATTGRDNIVWATAGTHNIVWATAGARNIVWATGAENDGTSSTSAAPEQIVWPVEKR